VGDGAVVLLDGDLFSLCLVFPATAVLDGGAEWDDRETFGIDTSR
jgi:hypothetical protein